MAQEGAESADACRLTLSRTRTRTRTRAQTRPEPEPEPKPEPGRGKAKPPKKGAEAKPGEHRKSAPADRADEAGCTGDLEWCQNQRRKAARVPR